MLYDNKGVDLSALVNDYLQFFIFQKATIYTLGYIAIAIILHQYFINEKLHIEVQELSELKRTNKKLFKKLNLSLIHIWRCRRAI